MIGSQKVAYLFRWVYVVEWAAQSDGEMVYTRGTLSSKASRVTCVNGKPWHGNLS